MLHDEHGTTSPWVGAAVQSLHPLRENLTADVVVVGAGIAGMSVAYELAAKQLSVVVVEQGSVAGGETGRSTAHLVTALDERYYELERMHGASTAALLAQSHQAAVSRIGEIAALERIPCGYLRVNGYLVEPPVGKEAAGSLVLKEFAAATRAGVHCSIIDRAPMMFTDSGPCLAFNDQAQCDPVKYVGGLAFAVQARGGRIFTGSHVRSVAGGSSPSVITMDGFRVEAGAVVVATNTPVNDVVTMHTKQVAYRSYVIGMSVPWGAMEPALLWDGFWHTSEDWYHYVRLRFDRSMSEDLLIVGGEDHRTGREHDFDERYRRLESWARERFPAAQEVAYRWSGQIMEPHDEVAFIGHNPGQRNVYVVTGDSGNGMTHGAIAGIMLPSLISGQEHPWQHVYSPSRLPVHAAGTTLSESAKMIGEYRDWVTPHPGRTLEELRPGEGAVVRVHGRLCAVYKGLDGSVAYHSAVCPHLYGIVRWNDSERSWDCPCHGSRFDCRGNVICGPAITGLERVESPEKRAAAHAG